MQNILSSFKVLEECWIKKYPSHAQGGRLAIAGFCYQFNLYLLSLVENWLSLGDEERATIDTFLTYIENISDILIINHKAVIATQVKLTLRSNNLIDTLEEFVTIEDTAVLNCPELIPHLYYLILTSHSELGDIKETVKRWSLKHFERTGKNVDNIIDKLEVKAEALPENSLMSLLANKLNCPEPLMLMQRWLGYLNLSSYSNDVLKNVGKYIWNDLQELWRKINPIPEGLYIWQDKDIPPNEIKKGPVLTGQRPTVRHLREGYFCPRVSIYKDLEDNMINWIEQRFKSMENKVQIFWIGGRSGSGKSVALLHMLSGLHDKGYGPLIWISHHTFLLKSAIQFALTNSQKNNTTIIGLDDPYSAYDQENAIQNWSELFSILNSVRQDEGLNRIPILVACGPTEQAEIFRNDFGEEVEIHIVEIPPEDTSLEDTSEIKILREWYSKRTNSVPPEVGNNNVLMVQLFFQWERHESIFDFSKRLRERIIQGDPDHVLLDRISRVLALNRLYIGYLPSAVRDGLTPQQKDKLDWLENDLHFGAIEVNNKPVYWLLHPHLSNAIYLNWYNSKLTSFREYIKAGIFDFLHFGQSPTDQVGPLWSLVRIIKNKNDEDLQQRIDYKTACIIFQEIFNELMKQFKNKLPIYLLPVWVEICSITPDVNWVPSPINMALDIIDLNNIYEKGLRLTCHKILEYYSNLDLNQRSLFDDRIYKLLDGSYEWYEWFPIAENSIATIKKLLFVNLVFNKVKNDLSCSSNIANLFFRALKTWPDYQLLTETVCAYLNNAPCSIEWGNVVICLINNGSYNHVVKHWLTKHNIDQHIFYALSEALKHDYKEFEEIALSWARAYYSTPYSNFILELLLKHRNNDSEVIYWCHKWLIVGEGEKSYILESLLKHNPVSYITVNIAVNWLNNISTDHTTWIYIWKALLNIKIEQNIDLSISYKSDPIPWPYIWLAHFKVSSNVKLFELGKIWLLETDIKHYLWILVWLYLYNYNQNDQQLIQLGHVYFNENNLKNILWPTIYIALTEKICAITPIYELGFKWLVINDYNNAGWPYVFESLQKMQPKNEDIYDLGLKWLYQNDFYKVGWPYVFVSCTKLKKNDETIYNLGVTWLYQVNFNNIGWPFVFESCLIYKKDDTEILELGVNWLTHVNLDNVGWPFIFESCVEWCNLSKTDNIEIYNLGIKWLSKITIKKHEWIIVFKSLKRLYPKDNFLYEIGFKWLSQVNLSNKEWASVFKILRKMNIRDSELYDLGVRLLVQTNYDNSGWPAAFTAIVEMKSNDINVYNLGIKWLLQSDFGNEGWGSVYSSLTMINSKDLMTYNLGLKWLSEVNVDNRSWPLVFVSIKNIQPNDKASYFEYGLKWLLKANFKNKEWHIVFDLLYKLQPQCLSLYELGSSWLSQKNYRSRGWSFVFSDLIKIQPNNSSHFEMGLEWLSQTRSKNIGWSFVFSDLIKIKPNNLSLFNIGLEWLLQTDLKDTGWSFVFAKLIKIQPNNSALFNIGLEWLSQIDFNNPGWTFVFIALIKIKPNDSSLYNLGIDWLSQADLSNTKRASVDAILKKLPGL